MPYEIKELGRAKDSKGHGQNLDKICQSKTFEQALQSRMEWWRHALSPKPEGWGYTYKQGVECIKHHYAVKKGRKKRDVFSFLKISYKPPQKIQTKRAFTEAVIAKSIIGRDLGKYGAKLRHGRAPVLPGRCSLCRGVGELQNISGQRQTCPRCGGTGRSGRPRYL